MPRSSTKRSDHAEEDPKDMRARLQSLIDKHHGNLSAMARAEKVTRQSIAKQLETAGLEKAAELARFKGGVSGSRSDVTGKGSKVAEKEKGAIERALATTKTAQQAADKLGITRSALYRRIAVYGIARPTA